MSTIEYFNSDFAFRTEDRALRLMALSSKIINFDDMNELGDCDLNVNDYHESMLPEFVPQPSADDESDLQLSFEKQFAKLGCPSDSATGSTGETSSEVAPNNVVEASPVLVPNYIAEIFPEAQKINFRNMPRAKRNNEVKNPKKNTPSSLMKMIKNACIDHNNTKELDKSWVVNVFSKYSKDVIEVVITFMEGFVCQKSLTQTKLAVQGCNNLEIISVLNQLVCEFLCNTDYDVFMEWANMVKLKRISCDYFEDERNRRAYYVEFAREVFGYSLIDEELLEVA